jgi:hypothetical protein
VWALLSVEAGVGKAETLDGAAMEKMFGDDLVDVADVYEAVPDGLGIDHDDGAVLALIEATGLVGSNVVPEAGFLDGVLEGGFEFLLPAWRQLGREALSSRSLVQMKM